MSGNHEYVFDIAAYEMWQREQCEKIRDDEVFTNIIKKVIQNELNEKEKETVFLLL
jgi:hypothetical protein